MTEQPNKFRVTYRQHRDGWIVTVELVWPLPPRVVLASLHATLQGATDFGDWWMETYLYHDFALKRNPKRPPSSRDWGKAELVKPSPGGGRSATRGNMRESCVACRPPGGGTK